MRTLVAPAGYGKSTLAEQWVARDGRRGAWFTARSSSTDVAALALGLARACGPLVEGCDVRLREHLRALPAPAENVETLAEILGEDLAAWPDEGWLVIDDYQEITLEPKAERFVAALLVESPLQFLIASRQRPAWVSSKRILYGDVLEINQTALAMDTQEAADVLVGRSSPSASGLVSLANGWPAVIGLAGVSSAEIQSETEQVPESLYRFFAEEVFSALGEDVQQGMTTLSVAPVLDRELAGALIGSETAEVVCAAALDVGILVERGVQLELHPLARSFLDERSEQLGLTPAAGATGVCLEHYRSRHDWDAAFDVVVRWFLSDELEPLVRAALDDLLDTARLPTVQRWCEFASDADLEAATFSVARAEVALRYGRHVEAIAHAEGAASLDSELAFRALSIAGRAAHLASREDEALELYRRAETAAATESEQREARWGQLLCAIELEMPDAEGWLRALTAGVRRSDVKEVVRSAATGLSYQMNMGTLELTDADSAAELLGGVGDPMLVSAFQSGYSAALAFVARYDEALEHATAFLASIRRYRLDFARPHALCSGARALAGLRRWKQADEHLTEAIRIARTSRDAYAQQVGVALRMRLLAQQARFHEALTIEIPVRSPLPSARAEVVLSRALVLASAGRTAEARSLLDEVRGLSQAVEPAVLAPAVEAICALRQHSPDAIERVAELENAAFGAGAVDILVTAYRSAPELLTVLLRSSTQQERITGLIRAARDEDLACAVGRANFHCRRSPREVVSS